MMAYVTAGMMHCHNRNLIAHQDFKPENIFVRDLRADFAGLSDLDVFRIPKIADFGSANLAAEVGEFRGTRAYMAPEQWDKQPLGEATTAWSIGVITYELLSYGTHPIGERTRPWREATPEVWKRWQDDRMWKRWMRDGSAPRIALEDRDMDDLVRCCLGPVPASRPTLREISSRLLERLHAESPEASQQVRLLISQANSEGRRDHNWPYLDARYEWLVQKVSAYFEDEGK